MQPKPIISVAPMMDRTDRHCRYFLRLIAPHIRLYTEMITASALLHGDADYLLQFSPEEKYIALQLGGNNPVQLARAAKLGEQFGYDEINLNVGCPSTRVKSGQFGASLMLNPELVADCVSAMQAAVNVPVTIKCRIGVDDQDSYENLCRFIELNAQAGCKLFIIHARKAWLSGLSPKQNRMIPPLRYDVVKQIKIDFPHLEIVMNGGIKSLEDIKQHCLDVDGFMIGREAYSNPYCLALIEQHYFDHQHVLTRAQVIHQFLPYIREQLKIGVKLTNITRHLLGLFQGERGARLWRRHISQYAHAHGNDVKIIESALALTISS